MRIKSTIVGLLVFLALGLAAFHFLSQEPQQTPFTFHIVFAEVDGLEEGADVVTRGLKIGSVQSLELARRSVRATVGIDKKYRSKMDSKLSARIDSVAHRPKKFVRIDPGSPPGSLLKSGDVVQADKTNRQPQATAAESPGPPKVPVGKKTDQIRKTAEKKAMDVLSKGDTQAKKSRVDVKSKAGPKPATIDLDGPRQYRVLIHRLVVRETKADGKPWDVLGGAPDLQIRVWASTQQILLTPKHSNTFTLEFNDAPLRSEAFDWRAGESVGLQVTDLDLQANDKVGVLTLPDSARTTAGARTYRLSAGRIQEIVVSVSYQAVEQTKKP